MSAPIRFVPHGEGVLVTGCSSGIGRATAVYLAQQGFTVFATVRKQADADGLRDLHVPNLVPICPLDMTRLEQIPAVAETVANELKARGKEGLFAIVNNAGGGGIAPIELLELEKFRTELNARILGPVALLQAFLSMIRAAQGRVVWIVTPGLLPIPFVSSIHICDFAVNCLARTLQIELKRWNIPSIMIRCGGIQTAAVAKTADELEGAFQQWPSERIDLYREALLKEQHELSEFDSKRTEPEEVAKVVYAALCARKPKRRYQIGYMAGFAALLEAMPQAIVDSVMARRV